MRTLSLATLILITAGAALLYAERDNTSSVATAGPVIAAQHQSGSVSDRTVFPTRPEAMVTRASYRMRYRHEVRFGDEALEPTLVKGIWTTEPLISGRVEVTLSDLDIHGQEALPEAAEIEAPFQLGFREDRLSGLAFEPNTPRVARELLNTLAVAFAYTPGQGGSWTVDEEDRTGRFRAHYQRSGDRVVRTREGFLQTRTPEGLLTDKRAAGLTCLGETRYQFDDMGLASLEVEEHLLMHVTDDLPPAEVEIRASLERVDRRQVVARRGANLALENILPHVQHGDDSQSREEENLAGATLEDLMREIDGLRDLPAKSDESLAARRQLHKRLRAMLRLNPASAADLARKLTDMDGSDPRPGAALTGALGSAGTPAATNALAMILPELSGNDKMNATIALGLTQAPTTESANALNQALRDPHVESVAALALGTQAKRLAPEDSETADSLVDTLLAGYESATTISAKATYLGALGNTGDIRALPVLRDVVMSGHTQLAPQATYALRFIPGEEVDILLDTQLASGVLAIQEQAVRAIGSRDPGMWRTRLEDVYESAHKRVKRRIDQALRQWG